MIFVLPNLLHNGYLLGRKLIKPCDLQDQKRSDPGWSTSANKGPDRGREKCQAGQGLVWLVYMHVRPLSHLSDRSITLGKAGSFFANELVGEPYGLTYEIVDKKLTRIPPKTIQEVGRYSSGDIPSNPYTDPQTRQRLPTNSLMGGVRCSLSHYKRSRH